MNILVNGYGTENDEAKKNYNESIVDWIYKHKNDKLTVIASGGFTNPFCGSSEAKTLLDEWIRMANEKYPHQIDWLPEVWTEDRGDPEISYFLKNERKVVEKMNENFLNKKSGKSGNSVKIILDPFALTTNNNIKNAHKIISFYNLLREKREEVLIFCSDTHAAKIKKIIPLIKLLGYNTNFVTYPIRIFEGEKRKKELELQKAVGWLNILAAVFPPLAVLEELRRKWWVSKAHWPGEYLKMMMNYFKRA